MDPLYYQPKRGEPMGTAGLPMFDAPDAVLVPDVRTPPPVAPGSATSQLAATALSVPFRRKSWRQIMLTLGAADGLLSMHDISEATGLPINVVCARIPELEPLWVERTRGGCRSHAKAGLSVDGFGLTDAGRRRVRESV